MIVWKIGGKSVSPIDVSHFLCKMSEKVSLTKQKSSMSLYLNKDYHHHRVSYVLSALSSLSFRMIRSHTYTHTLTKLSPVHTHQGPKQTRKIEKEIADKRGKQHTRNNVLL